MSPLTTGYSVGKYALPSREVARQVCVYGQTRITDKSERTWPSNLNLPPLTSTEKSADSEVISLPISRTEPVNTVQQQLELVEGVVDDIEGDDARVRLYYAGRENNFVFSVTELEAVGAGYPGAVFGVSVGTDHSYAIVHLAEREQAIRAQAPPPDLSFLEEQPRK
jgi:hypothetical protein